MKCKQTQVLRRANICGAGQGLRGFEEIYTSKSKTLAGNETGGFAVTNLTLFTQRLVKRPELSAPVYNLFDKHYGDPGGAEHRMDVIEQDGRSFRVKLTYTF